MNPPSALHSAMSRDRKPFTYTPGGINLSEIKSQRMAQRLMRNAMNPGVPQAPVNPVTPSANPTTPKVLPNYNCMPVQVFPAMPANPKSLLRTRSYPGPRDPPDSSVNPPAFVNNSKFENNDTSYKNTPTHLQNTNNNRPVSMYENSGGSPANNFNAPRLSYGSDGYTAPVNTNLPTPSKFGYAPVVAPVPAPVAAPVPEPTVAPMYAPTFAPVYAPVAAPVQSLSDVADDPGFYRIPRDYSDATDDDNLLKYGTSEDSYKVPVNEEKDTRLDLTENSKEDDVPVNSVQDVTVVPLEEAVTYTPLVTKSDEDADVDNEQREVKVVKKQVTKEKEVEQQNGSQNGDANGETVTTVKLPAKKSAAKTETKVEIESRTLPDGSIEEVKTTITKTTIDGRTEIKTRKETTIIPKEPESEEEVVEEEEEEGETVVQESEEQQEEETNEPETVTVTQTISASKQNGSVVKTEEKSETTVAKKVVVVQESEPEPEEEVEEVEEVEEEDEPVTFVVKKQPEPEKEKEEENVEKVEETVEKVEEKEEEVVEEPEPVKEEVNDEPEVEEEEVQEVVEVKKVVKEEEEEEEEEVEEEYEEAEEEKQVEVKEETKTETVETQEEKVVKTVQEEVKEDVVTEKISEPEEAPKKEDPVVPEPTPEPKEEKPAEKPEEKPAEFTVPIREPSVPLEKVEDVEIKPIGITPIITKTHTENTEIITSTIDPAGGLSKQTEYNKIENIVTVNRTTKILDHSYENMTQQGIPTVKTYFPPPSIDRISTSPLPSRPYQPVYPSQPLPTQTPSAQPTTERRHSLLLERLSMERQMPSDIYQNNYQSYDQTQYQEPQSEILTVSNVKPSTITNSQWYQQKQSSLYNNVTSSSTSVGAPWAQPKSPQPQQQYQPQPQFQPQPQQPPHYQAQFQPPYQRGTTPQPQFQRGTTPQPQYQKAATPQPQYQPSYTEPAREKTPINNYSTYTPAPTWVANAVETTPTQYSYLNQDTSQSYQKSTLSSTSQQYSSSYVPPPWEQDSSYTSVNNTSEKYYQEVPQTNTFSPAPSQGWKPPPSAKSNKTPIAYIPPAPNQSFVKPVNNVEPPRQPGRKTYYSEYERRYITVPESTYIPTETKYQPQPDASPQYYYDNNEPTETVEPQWRKELREFTEKTSSQTITEQTSVQPPWESDPKYAKTPSSMYTPTPTWSQTLRPQSHRERSFESEFVSQEWPKTNTLGRGRPLSSYDKSSPVPERARGVSVDRYNPNNYQPPAEHPPVQTHTLTTPAPHAGYHNPNVPAYHARASAEPREQRPTNFQQRVYSSARASPLQSRSFKYLQWITDTEN